MKRQFVFAHSCGDITPNTTFFLVSVGNSEHERRAAGYMATLAQSTDYFWQQQGLETDEFLRNVAISLFHDAVMPLMELKFARIDVQALVRCIKDGSLQSLEDVTPAWAATAFHQRAAIDGDFRFRMRGHNPCNSVT